jgi:hypothetical protein
LVVTRCILHHAAASNPQDHITRRIDIMSTVADNLAALRGKRETTGAMMTNHTTIGERITALGELLIQYGLVLVVG